MMSVYLRSWEGDRTDVFVLCLTPQKESEKRNVTVQADDPISFMQLTAKNETSSKEDQFQLSLLAAMGNTQRKEASDPLASKLNKVKQHTDDANITFPLQ